MGKFDHTVSLCRFQRRFTCGRIFCALIFLHIPWQKKLGFCKFFFWKKFLFVSDNRKVFLVICHDGFFVLLISRFTTLVFLLRNQTTSFLVWYFLFFAEIKKVFVYVRCPHRKVFPCFWYHDSFSIFCWYDVVFFFCLK